MKEQSELFPFSISSPASADSPSPSSQSWPTPDHQVFGDGQTEEALMNRKKRELEKKYNGNGGGIPLATKVRMRSEQSDSQRSMSTPAEYSESDGPTSPTSEPFSQSLEIQFLSGAVYSRLSSLVDSLASHTPLQESAVRAPMSAIYGTNALECFGNYDPSSRSSRMSAGCLALSQDFFSTEFCQTWPSFGTLANGRLYLQKTLELHIAEIASGYSALMNWKTPHGLNNDTGQQGGEFTKQVYQEAKANWPTAVTTDGVGAGGRNGENSKAHKGVSLTDAVVFNGDSGKRSWTTPQCQDSRQSGHAPASMDRDLLSSEVTKVEQKNWPTAAASSAEQGQNEPDGRRGQTLIGAARGQNWPTARAEDGESAGNHPGAVDSLTGAMKQWPTVRASEYKDSGPNGSKSQRHMLDRNYLCAVVNEEEFGPQHTDTGQPDQANLSTSGSHHESWATPQAQDARNINQTKSEYQTLPSDMLKAAGSGKLNPSWVETLMGYPIGHTQLPTVFRGSKRSATPSSPALP